MKLKPHETYLLRMVAHHLLHETELSFEADADLHAFVKPEVLHTAFPLDGVRARLISKLEGMRDDHEGNFCEEVIRAGRPLWTVSRVLYNQHDERTGRIETTGLRLTDDGIDALISAGYLPREFAPTLAHARHLDQAGQSFRDWLATEWKDPTVESVVWLGRETTSRGREATIKGTSHYVQKLSYATIKEVATAHERIDADLHLTARTKAAYKAHVTRRLVA